MLENELIALLKNNNKIFFELVDKSKQNNIFAHCYLINSPNNKQLNIANYYLAKEIFNHFNLEKIQIDEIINQINPNFIITKANDNNNFIKEDIIKNINLVSYTSTTNDKCKIIIIENIENASNLILNSILKFVEEPPKNVFIIMNTYNLASILETIKSRSQIIKLNDFSKKDKQLMIDKLNIDKKYKKFVFFANDLEKSQIISDPKIVIIFDNLVTKLIADSKNYKANIIDFILQINKDNHFIFLMFLKAISNDIIYYDLLDEYLIEQSVVFAKLYQSYKSFFINLIIQIDEFFRNINNNGNFNLHKNYLILNIK